MRDILNRRRLQSRHDRSDAKEFLFLGFLVWLRDAKDNGVYPFLICFQSEFSLLLSLMTKAKEYMYDTMTRPTHDELRLVYSKCRSC